MIACERCGGTTTDPDLWDPELDTGLTYCDRCWPIRDQEPTDDERARFASETRIRQMMFGGDA